MAASLDDLYASLQLRLRPEDVAELILPVLGDSLSAEESAALDAVTHHSLKRGLHQLTSMAQTFHEAVPPVRQVRKAEELFLSAYSLSPLECTDADKLRLLISHLGEEIRKSAGASNFLQDRLNRKERAGRGLDFSRRRYNKLFRFLARLENKVARYQLEQRKCQAMRIAKSSLASHICAEDFRASAEAACFIAYYTARANRRSAFTNQGQDRPFDRLCHLLLERYKRNPHPRGWRAIAHVYTDRTTLAELDQDSQTGLLCTWLEVLAELADLLEQTWQRSHFDRARMVVARGDDSSTWNALAGAWNAARQGWLGMLHALGAEESLEQLCLGKVMRLMAGDVVAWHFATGGQTDPDTQVWAELPAPWDVLAGRATCSRQDVIQACARHGIDAKHKGWISPPGPRRPVPFRPTPELVHGVAVSSPKLAIILRQAGWFSAKASAPLPDTILVERDEHGMALLARSADKPRP